MSNKDIYASTPIMLSKPEWKGFTHAYLDVNDQNPDLWGDAILLRDDDGMGFALGLEKLRGKFVKITIEEAEPPVGYQPHWLKL